MNLNKSFFLGAAASFFGLLLLAELFLRWAVPSGFWYSHFDPAGDMSGLSELRDRLRYASREGERTPFLLVGDSVLGSSALLEHRLPEAKTQTLYSYMKAGLKPQGRGILSLGSDGLLLPDIEGLSVETRTVKPEKILLLLNNRMFAEDFVQGPKALSRKFLISNLPPEVRAEVVPPAGPEPEALLSDKVYEALCRDWFLFREAQMLRTLWYSPSRKDFFERQLEKITGIDDSQTDILEAALKQKTAAYYKAYLWDTNSLPFGSLKRTLDLWVSSGALVTVVLTPQNTEFLGSYLDKPSFEKNRRTLMAFLKTRVSPGIKVEDWTGRYVSDFFLDHCHLTPEGNERYAKDLAALLTEGKK